MTDIALIAIFCLHTSIKGLTIQRATRKPPLAQEMDLLGVRGEASSGSTITTHADYSLHRFSFTQNHVSACSLEQQGNEQRVKEIPPGLQHHFFPVTDSRSSVIFRFGIRKHKHTYSLSRSSSTTHLEQLVEWSNNLIWLWW